jgi:hypothetical protein
MRTAARLSVLLAAAAAAGCGGRPRAPALTDEPVYENDRAGLRFVAPPGWVMGLRSELPPGRLGQPLQLVRYQAGPGGGDGPEKPADLTVLAVDLADGTDPGKYLADHPVGGGRWAAATPQSLTVNGAAATRYEYTAASAKAGQLRREVTAFRRGGRVYFFMTTFAATDTAARDQVRQAVNSVVWKE